jgi:hypothetical protein
VRSVTGTKTFSHLPQPAEQTARAQQDERVTKPERQNAVAVSYRNVGVFVSSTSLFVVSKHCELQTELYPAFADDSDRPIAGALLLPDEKGSPSHAASSWKPLARRTVRPLHRRGFAREVLHAPVSNPRLLVLSPNICAFFEGR